MISTTFPLFTFFCVLVTAQGQVTTPPDLPGIPAELAKLIEESNRPVEIAPEKLEASDPLSCARILSTGISGDPDKAYETKFRIGLALLQKKRFTEALQLAENMKDYRAGLLFLTCAEDLLQHGGDRSLATRLIQKTEQQVVNCKPWQQEILRGRLYLAGELLEWQNSTLTAILGPVKDQQILVGTQVLSMLRKQMKRGAFDEVAVMRLIEGLEQPVPELLESCRLVFGLALEALLKKDPQSIRLADQLMAMGMKIAQKSNVLPVDLYLEVAGDFAEAGFEDQSMALYRACNQRFGGDAEGVAHTMYHLANLWQNRGKGPEMKALLAPFEVKIREMRQMDQPFGLIWMAAAWRVIGESKQAEACLPTALQAAESNINPRMRFLGLIEICLCYSETNRPLEPAILEAMERVRNALPKP